MRQFLEGVTGLSIYPLFSFVLFGLFFLGVIAWMMSQSKSYYDYVSHLPLDAADGDTPAATSVTAPEPSNR